MINRADLLKNRLDSDTIEIDGVGIIEVRALNRHEAHQVQSANDTATSERLILRFGVVEPALTESEIVAWMAASPAGEIERVSNRIAELSGIGEGAGKSKV